jgi:signal transduction histidine kinase
MAPGGIETLLDALLDNAIKFTPAGGSITVTVRPVRTEDTEADPTVDIAVLDSGPGMDPDELERATDRFWRGPGQSNVEGTGLGLAIAARTAELSGGGLRVTARLPRAPHAAAPAQASLDSR